MVLEAMSAPNRTGSAHLFLGGEARVPVRNQRILFTTFIFVTIFHYQAGRVPNLANRV